MAELPGDVAGLAALHTRTTGDPRIVVAVIDGPVDVAHATLAGAAMRSVEPDGFATAASDDPTARHGTHVASILFGQHGTGVVGIAPLCTALLVPVFGPQRRTVPQIELARAIERAIDGGAHVINLSGGQYVDSGESDDFLAHAVEKCRINNVLLVAAAGNDGCDCLHVPAAHEAALAVGALGDDGQPHRSSNWGPAYATNGLLAPGENVLGACAGGGTIRLTGTSASAPIIAGVAALLLSYQLDDGRRPDPLVVRNALLRGAQPCPYPDPESCRRLLGGVVDIEGALSHMATDSEPISLSNDSPAPSCGCKADVPPQPAATQPSMPPQLAALMPDLGSQRVDPPPSSQSSSPEPTPTPTPSVAGDRTPTGGVSQSAGVEGSLIYALGTIGYDFGTEARRDSFKQLMPPVVVDDNAVPANPHDTRQMVAHLEQFPSEAQSLIWTINLELTPLYALEATGPFATDVYATLLELLNGEIQQPSSDEFVERASIPGRLSGRSVRLFSGQVVPVLELDVTRGMYGWRSRWLVDTAIQQVKDATGADVDEDVVAASLDGFLNRVYYDMRNLGVLSSDRALNFAATNAFQAASAFAGALTVGMQLDTIDVEPSPYARTDADAWDVKLKFFDPENLRRARRVYRFTVDVSEIMPVTLGEVRAWSTSS